MSHRFKLLIVDDQPDVRGALRRTLLTLGNEVQAASNAAEAIAMLARGHFDFIISDYDMPVMNGLALLRVVREKHPTVRRVLLTGRASAQLAHDALRDNTADRFLQKPWHGLDFQRALVETL